MEINPLIDTITDVSGNFRLEEVPEGQHDIQITFIGYEPFLIRELLVGSSKEVLINPNISYKIQF